MSGPDAAQTRLGRAAALLAAHYGPQTAPPPKGPFEMIVWEIVAYLAGDDRRAGAFATLREHPGLSPEQILAAPLAVLETATRAGGAIAARERAARLREAARLVVEQHGGDLAGVLHLPTQKAKRLLAAFPMIGEPGAEQILLFTGAAPLLALESNGLRVLTRTGIAREGKSYAATYRAAREVSLDDLPADTALLQQAHLLLRRHGQEICRRSEPACGGCPLSAECDWRQARWPG
jgi:endonuclease III